jgi:hypothetical protein
VAEGASNTEIAYNRADTCRAPSRYFTWDGGFVEFWHGAANTNVHHNHIVDTEGVGEFGGGGPFTGTTFSYNVVHNSSSFFWFNGDAPYDKVTVENNTIVNTTGRGYKLFGWQNAPSPGTALIRNNVVYANIQVANQASFDHKNNVYYVYGGGALGFALDSGEKQADPQFVNLASGDFHLQPASPGIDAGLSLGYTTDFEGKAVPAGNAPDAGAYEYRASAP